MKGVLRAELLSTRKRPGVWIVGGAWTVMAVGFGMVVPYIVWLSIRNRPVGSSGDPRKLIAGLLPDEFVPGTVDLYPMFGSALMLILGAVLAGGDQRWGTWGTLLVQRPQRTTALIGKAAATAVAVLCITVLVVAVSAGASGLVAVLSGRAAPWPGASELLGGIGAVWLVSMAAASLGIFLAILLRNTGAAIGAGLLWLLAVENLISGLSGALTALKWVQKLLIGPSAGSLGASLDPTGGANTAVPGVVSVSGPLAASLVLAAYVVLCLGLAAWLLNRRDVTA